VSDQRDVSAASQVHYASFDAAFFKLSPAVRARVEAKIDEIGSRLSSFPHHRLKGSDRFAFTKAMRVCCPFVEMR
jgi:hypothetical protein